MSCKSVISEQEKMKYEREFSDFLIQKINHAGGSLQFQHLSGIVQQLRFEIREEFGTTKKEIMNFLRTHPKIFKIDSKGLVTLVPSALEDYDNINIADKSESIKSKKTKQLKIENGKGIVEKISDEFGFIEALNPFQTTVFFTSLEYGGNKDILLTELHLPINSEVYFNAIYGHNDFEVEYRATKVWQCNSKKGDKSSYYGSFKNKVSISNLKDEDDISAYGKSNEAIGTSVADCDKNSRMQSQTIEVIKRSKPFYNHPSSQIVTKEKDPDILKKLENQKGKIYPSSDGVVIKFGKNFFEVANGNLCKYFLYGSAVSDIDWEFSEGDDILFDAIKSKTGWKASLAWVGEKPIGTNSIKTHIEEKNEIYEDQKCRSISDVSSESSYSSVKSKTMKSKFSPISTECSVKKENNLSCDNFISNKSNKSYVSFEQKNCEQSKSTVQKRELKKSKDKSKKENSHANKYKRISHRSDTELNENSSLICKVPKLIFSSAENISDINQNSSEDDKEFQFKKENKYDCTPRFKFKGSSKDEVVNSDAERKSCETHTLEGPTNNTRNEARVKQLKGIDGEVIHLYCKIAIVNCPYLRREVDFVCSTFYLNGKPLDEYNVADLKEVIQVGDIVKFNCFVIIDDKGDIHQKVTMAWKNGPKPIPVIPEMTPEEFIAESSLSVSLSNEFDKEYIKEHIPAQNSFFAFPNSTASDNTFDFDSQTTASLQIVSEDIKDVSENAMLQYPTETFRINEKNDELNIYYELLSDRVIQTLKNNGFISSDPKVDLNIVAHDIINSILENSNIKGTLKQEGSLKSICLRDSSEILCSNCVEKIKPTTRKMTTDAEVQTMITGEIVATSIYTQN